MSKDSEFPYSVDAQCSDRSAQVIQIDNGKAVNAVAICAALCGICTAVTIGTVWHHKDREVETQARIRVLQNHIDENTAHLKVIQQLEDKYHAGQR